MNFQRGEVSRFAPNCSGVADRRALRIVSSPLRTRRPTRATPRTPPSILSGAYRVSIQPVQQHIAVGAVSRLPIPEMAAPIGWSLAQRNLPPMETKRIRDRCLRVPAMMIERNALQRTARDQWTFSEIIINEHLAHMRASNRARISRKKPPILSTWMYP
jgi:hypothetical protein